MWYRGNNDIEQERNKSKVRSDLALIYTLAGTRNLSQSYSKRVVKKIPKIGGWKT